MPNYTAIQDEVVARYHVDLCDGTRCDDGDRARMHAHPRLRRVCKWKRCDSASSTFDLFHEIGHIEGYSSGLRRAEEEYRATCWAIDRFKEYSIAIPTNVLFRYQRYILLEVSRGLRRHGSGYPRMNLYSYAGLVTPAEVEEMDPDATWWLEPEALDIL